MPSDAETSRFDRSEGEFLEFPYHPFDLVFVRVLSGPLSSSPSDWNINFFFQTSTPLLGNDDGDSALEIAGVDELCNQLHLLFFISSL